MRNGLTMGSLFDGIGGFPLAAVREGIFPVWANEIETAPVSIPKRHFPDMRYLGDINNINGGEIEPVDIITFGSPCQDLSVSGKRAGLEGERSVLFCHALRVIKEMRSASNKTCPKRIVWENVPGAFSSNKGKDFKTVIEEIANIAEPGVSIPRPSEKTGWLASGGIVGDYWSMAWRTLDAQYWGLPQRRRRIFLVADFTRQCAGEILFEQEGKTGNIEKSETARKIIAVYTDKGVRPYVVSLDTSTDRIQMNPKLSVTLKANGGGNGANTGLYCLPDKAAVPYICDGFGDYKQGNISKTILSRDDITTGDLIVYGYYVRRLTPLECERLQGFPDGWTEYGFDGKRISDNQRYRGLGNSVAIPCVQYVLSGLEK
jgi:DNA (cytosine-5)-methyltransferase 1